MSENVPLMLIPLRKFRHTNKLKIHSEKLDLLLSKTDLSVNSSQYLFSVFINSIVYFMIFLLLFIILSQINTDEFDSEVISLTEGDIN